MFKINDKVTITKGCKPRDIAKGTICVIKQIIELGPDYSHMVKIVLKILTGFKGGQRLSFYARHKHKLNDDILRLNDGNPLHSIQIKKI